MTSDQLGSMVRSGLKILGTVAVMMGVGNMADWGVIGDSAAAAFGAGVTIYGIVLSWKKHA